MKIAQAAIGFGRHRRVFAEGLQILPKFEAMWCDVMAALLSHFGVGNYHYGSPWSLERPREHDITKIPGVTLTSTRAIIVYAVDFARWADWPSYFSDVSLNARRNARCAEKLNSAMVIQRRYGFSILKDVRSLMGLRKQLYSRKHIDFPSFKFAIRFLMRALVMRGCAFTVVVRIHHEPVAAFGGITFGANVYYIESGSKKDNFGTSWFLMLRMLKDAYEHAPGGCFVTGFHYADAAFNPGLAFYRDQCRSTGHGTSEIAFNYCTQ